MGIVVLILFGQSLLRFVMDQYRFESLKESKSIELQLVDLKEAVGKLAAC